VKVIKLLHFINLIILLGSCSLLFLAACGEEDDPEGESYTTLTVSILAPHVYEPVIRMAEWQMQTEFMLKDENIRFNVDLTTYHSWIPHENQQHQVRLQTMFMTGEAYNIIFWDSHPFRTYAEAGFLLDFYTLIDQHPIINRDDFHTNILEAFEHNGSLYLFPISFGFSYVGINANLPQSIINEFVWRDSITVTDLLQIYQVLRLNYSERFVHLSLGYAPYLRTSRDVLMAGANQFIDFSSRTSSLNSVQFIDFLELWRYAFPNINDIREGCGPHSIPVDSNMGCLSNQYIFAGFSGSFAPAVALFTPLEQHFLNVIPLVDKEGRLLIMNQYSPHLNMEGSSWAKLMIPAIGDGTLEWEFIQKLMTVMTETELRHTSFGTGPHGLATPITRRDFEPHFERSTNLLFNSINGRIRFEGIDTGNYELAMNEARNRLAAYNEMPVAIFEFNELNAPGLFLDENLLNHFLLGLSTADELAMELHNRMSLWLIE